MGRGRFYKIAKVGLGSFILALDFAISALIEKKKEGLFADRGTTKTIKHPWRYFQTLSSLRQQN